MTIEELTNRQLIVWKKFFNAVTSFMNKLFEWELQDEDFGWKWIRENGNASVISFKVYKIVLDGTHFKNLIDFMNGTGISIQFHDNVSGFSMECFAPKKLLENAETMTDEQINKLFEYESNSK